MPRYRWGKRTRKLSKGHKRILALCGVGLFIGGAYLLILVMSPTIITPLHAPEISNPPDVSTQAANRIVIPKIGVEIEYRSGGPEVLNEFAWYRYPERGNPVDGGNMIISAHRFSLAPTPNETRRRSPFYNIHRLSPGDDIYIYYEGKRYTYQVHERTSVSPLRIDIENKTQAPQLTIYSCTLAGERDGREVIFAHPV